MNGKRAAAIAAGVLLVLGLWCAVDPALDVPVVAPVVCAVKGGQWYGGGLLYPAGCYSRP